MRDFGWCHLTHADIRRMSHDEQIKEMLRRSGQISFPLICDGSFVDDAGEIVEITFVDDEGEKEDEE